MFAPLKKFDNVPLPSERIAPLNSIASLLLTLAGILNSFFSSSKLNVWEDRY